MNALIKYLTLLAILTGYGLLASTVNAQDDAASVKEANAQFYTALNAIFAGDLEPMEALWSHADDITYMGPDGQFQIGWSRVQPDWQKQAALKLGGKVEPGDAVINVGKDIAVVHNWENGQNVDPEGNPLKVAIRATNIFRKEEGHWKMIGHHTDLLPFLEK